jgi:flagellar motility protein MotE (MotC chaperone)
MANGKKNMAKSAQSPGPQGSESKKSRKHRALFGFLAFVAAVVVIIAVFGGAFYFVIHKNVNGIAGRYREEIQSIPVLRLALPEAPDPEDPKYLTDAEVRQKYQELRKRYSELQNRLEETENTVAGLQKYKDRYDYMTAENEKIEKDLNEQKLQLNEKIKQYMEDKKKFDELVALNDKEGFKEFFEKIDPENAKHLYTLILQEEKVDEEVRKIAKTYEYMDAAAVARILEQLIDSNVELVIHIFGNIKKEAASEILSSMNPQIASEVTEKLYKTTTEGR